MAIDLTLKHALSKKAMPELKELGSRFIGQPIDPNVGKKELIEALAPRIPEIVQDIIIDKTFNTPKTRYTAHLGIYNIDLPDETQIIKKCDEFISTHDFDKDLPDYQPNHKELLELVEYNDDQLIFYYTHLIRRAEFDHDTMESRPIVWSRKIRIVINSIKKIVTIFTGDKEMFNWALNAISYVLGKSFRPLDINKTGISEIIRGSFSYQTIKVLDFIYHGLSKVGKIGVIKQVDLDTPSISKKPQKVKVQGNDLLEDKSICEYLFIYGRELVGVKLSFIFEINNESFETNIELSIRENRIKIGIKKDNYSIDKIKELFEILVNITVEEIQKPGLINETETIKILDKIKGRTGI